MTSDPFARLRVEYETSGLEPDDLPADPIDAEMNVIYHRGVFSGLPVLPQSRSPPVGSRFSR